MKFALFTSVVAASASSSTPNIVELAESVKDLSTLVSAVVAGDLADALSAPGTFTVFAPTNGAFGKLPAGVVDSLMKPENKAQLVDILTYHVLPVEVKSTQLKSSQRVKTLEGKALQVFKDTKGVRVSPDGQDFKKVTAADNLASNGVVHIIDGVLLPPTKPTKPNIVELAESVPALSTLVAAVVAGDLADTLSSAGPFTVFAPTNDAFGALGKKTIDSLMKPANKAQLVDILTYHVLPEQVLSTDLALFQAAKTVEGKNLHVTVWGGVVKVGPSLTSLSKVTAADNLASNGVAHIIDKVLLPPSSLEATAKPNIVELAESVPTLSTLVAAVVAGDLADTLSSAGPFTVFAPTNDAFAALPAGVVDSLMKPENKAQLVDILTYHVLPEQVLSKDLAPFQAVDTVEGKKLHVQKWGGGVRVGPSLLSKDLKNVIAADNLASNGVAHIIDGVLLPPTPPAPKAKNIVELAQSVPSLSTLVTAVVAGDLAATLSSPGPFTVFAPTNDGFGKLPKGTVDTLLKPENKATLVDILTYHVLPSQVLSTDLKSFQRVKTVEGKNLHVYKSTRRGVRVTPDGRHFNTVTAADNKASNGVVHIIDGVLSVPSQVLV
jgi:transforming growth factor-beta-induced protein